MVSLGIPVKRSSRAGQPIAVRSGELLISLTAAVAVSGLAELLLQRVIYRVGVHIPRDGVFLEAYQFATFSGDFAFRTTAVLLAIASVAAILWLLEQRSYAAAGLLVALLAANLLAWPLGLTAGAQVAPMVFAFGAAWLVGRAVVRNAGALHAGIVVCAGLALALGQYRAGMTAMGREPGGIATIQLLSEVALLSAAALAFASALRPALSRGAAAAAAALTLVLVAAYAREPSTVAIVSLWATGVTMSLPGVLYIIAFGAVAFAAFTWLGRLETRPLAIALALLLVAGLQPQALHHGITAFLALTLLSLGLNERPEARIPREVPDGA